MTNYVEIQKSEAKIRRVELVTTEKRDRFNVIVYTFDDIDKILPERKFFTTLREDSNSEFWFGINDLGITHYGVLTTLPWSGGGPNDFRKHFWSSNAKTASSMTGIQQIEICLDIGSPVKISAGMTVDKANELFEIHGINYKLVPEYINEDGDASWVAMPTLLPEKSL